MRTEGHVNDTVTRSSQRRRVLSNITNLSLSTSWVSDPREGLISSTPSKIREGLIGRTPSKIGSYLGSQLQKENTALKRLLLEKDGTIETQAAQLDQMQKEFFVQVRRQTQVNEELVSYNSRLSKDGLQLRDQLKLLHHEYCQMTVAYRVSQSELQLKLAESQELLARLLHDKSSTDQTIKTSKKPRSSSIQRRHSISNTSTEDCNTSAKQNTRRSSSVSREETSGSRQTQQKEAQNPPAAAPTMAPKANPFGDLIGLDPMPEGSCEDDSGSPRESSASVEASSTTGEELSRAGKSGSGLTSESTSRRRRSSGSESSGCGEPAAAPQLGNNTSKANQRVSSSATAPHFSRRMGITTSLSSESGRPVRSAAVKIGSYAEPPLNTKMRRPD